MKSIMKNTSSLLSGGSYDTAEAPGGLGMQIFHILKQIVLVIDKFAL